MSFGQTVYLMHSATLGKKQTANRQKHHKPPVKHGSEGVVVWAYFAATGPEHLAVSWLQGAGNWFSAFEPAIQIYLEELHFKVSVGKQSITRISDVKQRITQIYSWLNVYFVARSKILQRFGRLFDSISWFDANMFLLQSANTNISVWVNAVNFAQVTCKAAQR